MEDFLHGAHLEVTRGLLCILVVEHCVEYQSLLLFLVEYVHEIKILIHVTFWLQSTLIPFYQALTLDEVSLLMQNLL